MRCLEPWDVEKVVSPRRACTFQRFTCNGKEPVVLEPSFRMQGVLKVRARARCKSKPASLAGAASPPNLGRLTDFEDVSRMQGSSRACTLRVG